MIKPLGARVVIKKIEAEEKTQGGLILTSQSKEAPQYAEVDGGYTQIYKMGPRRGDGAEVAIVKLVATASAEAETESK